MKKFCYGTRNENFYKGRRKKTFIKVGGRSRCEDEVLFERHQLLLHAVGFHLIQTLG